jgi:hypothetical protein
MKLNERLAWTDWLGLVWLTLLVGLSLVGMHVVARIVLIFRHEPIDVVVHTGDVGAVGAPARLPSGVEYQTEGWIRAQNMEPTLSEGALDALTSVPTSLVLAGTLLVLLRVVKDAWDRNPFSARTIRRLRLLGVTLLLGGCLAEAVESAATLALDQPIQFDSVGTYLIVPWWFIAGLAALAVAEVISRGFAMWTELETLV